MLGKIPQKTGERVAYLHHVSPWFYGKKKKLSIGFVQTRQCPELTVTFRTVKKNVNTVINQVPHS